jgi:nicotinamidase-related amidase
MPHTLRLDINHAQLVVVDMQERMLPHVADQEAVIAQTVRMIRAAQVMELPITLTEQYPQGLGQTDARVLEALGEVERFKKQTFSAYAEPRCKERLVSLMRPQVMLVGVETHVCVRQTALDLLEARMRPVVLADAVGSRRPTDRQEALDGLRAAGVPVTTVEAAIFDLLVRSGTELFKRILPIVR